MLSSLGFAYNPALYPFKNPVQQQRFQQLTGQLRCLVCQNESLAASLAPLAGDLRNKVYVMMREGKNNSQITDYLRTRYGDFVSYKPPVDRRTYLLWFGPFFLLLLGVFILFRKVRQAR